MVSIFLAEDQQMLNSALVMLLDLEDNFSVVGTETDGQAALEKVIRLMKLDIKIIILTTFARSKYFKDALAAKVNGYLLKDSLSDSLVNAIKTIMNGDTVFDPKLVTSVLNTVDNPLTDREQEILAALKTCASTKELAQKFFLSEGTIRNYISSILSKTGTRSRLEAVNLAEKRNWI